MISIPANFAQQCITPSKDFHQIFYVNSSKYEDFLLDIFSPNSKHPISGKEIKTLLKESFISEEFNTDLKLISRFDRDAYLLLLGINTAYPNQIKHYVNQLQTEIKRKETANQEVLAYKDNVTLLIERELTSYTSKIEDILNSAYANHLNRYNESIELYNKSKALLSEMNAENEQLLSRITNRLNIQFQQNLNHLFISDNFSIEDVINSNFHGYSYGKKMLLNLIARLVIQSDFESNNAVGFIANDSGSRLYEEQTSYRLRSLIKQTCISKGCQYIEFTFNTDIDRNDVVYELERGGRYA